MAYIDQKTKKSKLDALKEAFPELKFSASIEHHMKIRVKVKNKVLFDKLLTTRDEPDTGMMEYLNKYGIEYVSRQKNKVATLDKILAIINQDNYRDADVYRDYFDVGFYVELRVTQ